MNQNEYNSGFNIEKKKNKYIKIVLFLLVFLIPIGFGISRLFSCSNDSTPSYKVKISSDYGSGLTISENTAYADSNFSADIKIDKLIIRDRVLPDSLNESDVTCKNEPITFTYKVTSSDNSTANIKIPKNEIKGDIKINITLVTPTEKFPITLKANGGKFEDGDLEKTFNVSSGQTLNDLPDYSSPINFLEGYHFTHWELESDRTQKLNEDDKIPYTPGGATYVANCGLNPITVTINPNGGKFISGDTDPIDLNALYDTVINEIADYPGEPTKDGSTFLYYVDVNNKIYLPTDPIDSPEESFGLKAVYEENLEIVLDANGGIFPNNAPTKTLNGYKGITLNEVEDYIEPVSSTPGEEFTYWSINESGEYYKNTPLDYSGTITLTANYAECPHTAFNDYTVIDNKLYGICETCKAQIEIQDLSGYEGQFLLLENSSTGKLHDISEMANIINTAEDHSVLNIYFIKGEYELGGSRGAGQKVITVNAYGLLDDSGNPTASIDCTRSTEYPYPRYHLFINFVFENLKMIGEDEYADGFYFGLLASTITYNHCYFKGKQSFYSDQVICNDCEFDSTGMLDQPDYAIYSYSSYKIEFKSCVFKSDGKALKIYSEGAAPDAKFELADCNFFNEGKIRTDKAAIEVNSVLQPVDKPYKVYITRCHQDGYASLYHDDSTKADFIVIDCD